MIRMIITYFLSNLDDNFLNASMVIQEKVDAWRKKMEDESKERARSRGTLL